MYCLSFSSHLNAKQGLECLVLGVEGCDVGDIAAIPQ